MHFIYTFIIMFGFWILMSGRFDLFHLTLGVISCLVVSFLSNDLLFHDKAKKARLAEVWRFIFYIPWLLKEIFTASLNVAYLALHPRMKDLIDPRIIVFKTKLKKDISKVTLANSITLTPGTITVRIVNDEYYVHAIDRRSAEVLPGNMEEKIKKVFEKE